MPAAARRTAARPSAPSSRSASRSTRAASASRRAGAAGMASYKGEHRSARSLADDRSWSAPAVENRAAILDLGPAGQPHGRCDRARLGRRRAGRDRADRLRRRHLGRAAEARQVRASARPLRGGAGAGAWFSRGRTPERRQRPPHLLRGLRLRRRHRAHRPDLRHRRRRAHRALRGWPRRRRAGAGRPQQWRGDRGAVVRRRGRLRGDPAVPSSARVWRSPFPSSPRRLAAVALAVVRWKSILAGARRRGGGAGRGDLAGAEAAHPAGRVDRLRRGARAAGRGRTAAAASAA